MRKPKDKKLCKAVEDFAAQMLDRLADKEEQGYKGWDGEAHNSITDFGLACEIVDDADALQYRIREKGGVLKMATIDIANRAMMLWYRDRAARAQAKEGE
jgi:hypothetical protein